MPQYDIGARRGTEQNVEAFIKDLCEKYSDYRPGRHALPDFRSVHRVTWGDSDEFTTELRVWLARWSRLHPDVEIFATVWGGWGSGFVEYVSFRKGEFYLGQKIQSHARFEELVASCECLDRPKYYERYPTEAPFADCPIRLNPPTQWAVENIMEVMERMPVRRAR